MVRRAARRPKGDLTNRLLATQGSLPEPPTLAQVVGSAFPRSRHETRTWLVAQARVTARGAGETVLAQGEQTRTLLVLDGHVGYRRTAPDGRELIPRVVSSGEIASLLPLAGRPSVVEAVALSPSRVALWAASDLQARAADDAGLALDLLEHVLLSFEAVVERLEGFLYQNALRRVARVLELHGGMLFSEAGVLSRRFLPALVGTSREMTRRVLRSLEAKGVVARVGSDGLELLDAAALAQTAAPRHGA